MEKWVRFRDFILRYGRKNWVREKPFRVLKNGKEVPVIDELKTGEKVEILERKVKPCPSCIGAGYIFSDGCRDCREQGKVAFFLVKVVDNSQKRRAHGKSKRVGMARL